MFQKKPSEVDMAFDDLVFKAIAETSLIEVTDESYATAKKNLAELMKIRESNRPKSISPDALLAAGVNLAGILAILHHERMNVIASKALGFVMKLR